MSYKNTVIINSLAPITTIDLGSFLVKNNLILQLDEVLRFDHRGQQIGSQWRASVKSRSWSWLLYKWNVWVKDATQQGALVKLCNHLSKSYFYIHLTRWIILLGPIGLFCDVLNNRPV